MPPTPPQIRKIMAAARELDLDEGQLRDLIGQRSATGSRSKRELTVGEAAAVIDDLVRLGASSGTAGARGKKPSGRRSPAGVTRMITPEQREMIEQLRAELGGSWIRDEYFAGACRKRLRGKERPATSAEAATMIEVLKQRRAYDRSRAGER
jgi:hypothetical protein